jgi:hypothetical protein
VPSVVIGFYGEIKKSAGRIVISYQSFFNKASCASISALLFQSASLNCLALRRCILGDFVGSFTKPVCHPRHILLFDILLLLLFFFLSSVISTDSLSNHS